LRAGLGRGLLALCWSARPRRPSLPAQRRLRLPVLWRPSWRRGRPGAGLGLRSHCSLTPGSLPAQRGGLWCLGPGERGWRGLGRDAAPPAAATLWGVLPAARTPSHSGAAPGRAGEGNRLAAACGPGPAGRAEVGRGLLSRSSGAALRGRSPWKDRMAKGTAPLEIRREEITFVCVGSGEGGPCHSEA
jgi:hypothetical protein